MPAHNCSECSLGKNNACPLQSIAPWLNIHEGEVEVARMDSSDNLIKVCATFEENFGSLADIFLKDHVAMVCLGFVIGYHRGRTYQEVPEIFKEE